MQLECTKKLLDYIGAKPEKAAEPVDPLFAWTANLMVINRRKTLVAVHVASRSVFVLHGLTVKQIPKLPELILEGIRTLLRSEYVRPEIIERYLDECGRNVSFFANSSRKTVAGCNKGCERVKWLSELYEPGDLYQQKFLPWLNDDITNGDYIYEILLDSLREHYGDDIQSCRALELEVELQDTGCKRRIVVPSDFTFYQFHRVLQGAFGWHDCHLHEFILPGSPERILHPDAWEDEEVFEDSTQLTVGEIFGNYKTIGYVYDFGDCWYHVIKYVRTIEDCPDPYPHCVCAVGIAPREDSGGLEAFAEITRILNDPEDPEYGQIPEWVRDLWLQPLDVQRINFWIKNAHRRCIPIYW